jgi:hypothetical protein
MERSVSSEKSVHENILRVVPCDLVAGRVAGRPRVRIALHAGGIRNLLISIQLI